ncbi:MAG: CHC2 zinc finger domain-containing protein [Clostridia bacterium]
MNYAQEIKERLSVVDVLSRYGFEPDGHGFLLCPFHQEKTPSFRVYDNAKRWYCFGCGERGDAIDLVRKLFRLSFQQAVIRMDDDFNLGLLRQEKRTPAAERQRLPK